MLGLDGTAEMMVQEN